MLTGIPRSQFPNNGATVTLGRSASPATVAAMHRKLLLPVVAALLLVPVGAIGADPQPYAVTLTPTGNAALDQALQGLLAARGAAREGAGGPVRPGDPGSG